MAKPKRRFESDFFEDEIPKVIQSFLDVVNFPDRHLEIRSLGLSAERKTGADARIGEGIVEFCPFYMQFKRPSSWKAQATDKKIVLDRLYLDLDVEPETFFFELRKKAKTHTDFQHNMLYKLRQELITFGGGDATYVCPLFLKYDRYRDEMNSAARALTGIPGLPVVITSISILDELTNRIDFNKVPIFTRHVSIPPHRTVDTHEHAYSFRPDGQQICFHSPEELLSDNYLLSDWLNGLYDNRPQAVNERQSFELLLRLTSSLTQLEKDLVRLEEDVNWIKPWLRFGGVLLRSYQIYQFAFVRRA